MALTLLRVALHAQQSHTTAPYSNARYSCIQPSFSDSHLAFTVDVGRARLDNLDAVIGFVGAHLSILSRCGVAVAD